MAPASNPGNRLISITLDEGSIGRGGPEQEHERAIAIFDLIESNNFAVTGHASGPYALIVSLLSNKLALDIRDEQGQPVAAHILSLTVTENPNLAPTAPYATSSPTGSWSGLRDKLYSRRNMCSTNQSAQGLVLKSRSSAMGS